MVDGVEGNRAMVSPAAVEKVLINQDPYRRNTTGQGAGRSTLLRSRRRNLCPKNKARLFALGSRVLSGACRAGL